ncbi:hypothetical protein D3C72_1623070 [compost metagenome]
MFDSLNSEIQLPNGEKCLFVGIRSWRIEVKMCEAAECLDVDLFAAISAIEALRHEVASTAFLEESTLGHLDACGLSHLGVGIFDRPKSPAMGQILIRIPLDAIEFEQPIPESIASGGLARADFVGGLVPCDQGLRPRASR